LLSVQGNAYVSGSSFFGGAIVATSTLSVSGTGNSYILGNVGIGTTNPTYKLSVAGDGRLTGLLDASHFVATSSTATSTFAGGLVVAQCVTGDTKLRRRRKKGNENEPQPRHGDAEYDLVAIKDVQEGDEIASLDESTGRVVYSRVKQVMDMGEQEVFELVTKSGRRIRTTANHPYLARMKTEKTV
jgi:hypothetical protein